MIQNRKRPRKQVAPAAEDYSIDAVQVGETDLMSEALLAMAWLDSDVKLRRGSESSVSRHEEYVCESDDGEHIQDTDWRETEYPFKQQSHVYSKDPPASSLTAVRMPDSTETPFSLWFIACSLVAHLSLRRIPGLKDLTLLLYMHASPHTALFVSSLVSISCGFLAAINRNQIRKLMRILNPTKETTNVYYAVAATVLGAYYLIPKFFMFLHFVIHHVPFVGALVVFWFLTVLVILSSVAAFGAIGMYSWDVSVTVHGCIKRWLGFKTGQKKVSSSLKRDSFSSESLSYSSYPQQQQQQQQPVSRKRGSMDSNERKRYYQLVRERQERYGVDIDAPSYVGF
ncbi:hypothetical protein BJ741DRAFT_660580 [Chytriomyces cf. hyalinus JEL632]|nr:hypothetical protein BJ741DRAFT_660580 [Chytriomyces cf. hyalinus JEL632]